MEFTLKTKIKATAKQIYKSWLSTQRHTKMTGSPAFVSDQVGDKFSAGDGYIKGENLFLEPYNRIVQSWRTSNFKDNDEDSKIEISLKEFDDGTELTLFHSNVPEEGTYYIEGWDEHYFQPMKTYFKSLN